MTTYFVNPDYRTFGHARTCHLPSIRPADQPKVNRINGELARAKARRDHHLIKQLEQQLRDLTNG